MYNTSSNAEAQANSRSRTSLKIAAMTVDDVFLRSQNHFNDKFVREAKHIRQYQRHMDNRLSVPKKLA